MSIIAWGYALIALRDCTEEVRRSQDLQEFLEENTEVNKLVAKHWKSYLKANRHLKALN